MRFDIQPIHNDFSGRIIDLVLPIQQIEFNVPVTLESQPDLLDIDQYYHETGGCFWGAILDGELVGTIGMIATGHKACAIRKMFVKKEFRGKAFGIAQCLLDTLIEYCRTHQIEDIYLGTVDLLKAAHRFYERNGFERYSPANLPVYFPRVAADNLFYHLHLGLLCD